MIIFIKGFTPNTEHYLFNLILPLHINLASVHNISITTNNWGFDITMHIFCSDAATSVDFGCK